MVQLTTFLTAVAVAIPAVSAICTCIPGQNYCGYTLLDGAHGCQPGDLSTPISDDIFNSLYECNATGQSATQIEYCGGPGTCQPPQHIGGACDGINACCDA